MIEYGLWIGGKERKGAAKRVVRLPYDGSAVAEVHEAGPAELEAALASARQAAAAMRALTAWERSEILRRAGEIVRAEREDLARTIASESGKPLREARAEADRAAQTLQFSAEEARRLAGEVVPMEASPAGAGRMAMTVREPVGVIAAITPFNFPLNLALHKIGPAIAGGNPVVHKPASATPLAGLKMARIFAASGLPAGALNVIPGPGAEIGDALVADARVAMVTFTGSAEVGLRIRARAGLKRVTLELGNNSALIVERDADLDDAVARAAPGSFAHSGQVCISVQRILVQEGVFDEFVERFAVAARAMRRGHPLDEATEVSSLITAAEAERVEAWIAHAEAAGARRVAGGERDGAAMAPVVLVEVPEEERIWGQEAFGPVAGINRYRDLAEAVERVNESAYGLQAGIFTRDLDKAFYAARRVEVGGFLINDVPQYRVDQMPYGGVKLSGTGREGPKYAVEEMTEVKLICWRMS